MAVYPKQSWMSTCFFLEFKSQSESRQRKKSMVSRPVTSLVTQHLFFNNYVKWSLVTAEFFCNPINATTIQNLFYILAKFFALSKPVLVCHFTYSLPSAENFQKACYLHCLSIPNKIKHIVIVL